MRSSKRHLQQPQWSSWRALHFIPLFSSASFTIRPETRAYSSCTEMDNTLEDCSSPSTSNALLEELISCKLLLAELSFHKHELESKVRDANNQLEAERAARAKDLAERESPAAAGFAGARPSTRLPSPPELDVASPWVQPSRFVQPRESCDALRPGDGVAKTRAHHKALLHCEVVRGDAAPRAATPASATLPDGLWDRILHGAGEPHPDHLHERVSLVWTPASSQTSSTECAKESFGMTTPGGEFMPGRWVAVRPILRGRSAPPLQNSPLLTPATSSPRTTWSLSGLSSPKPNTECGRLKAQGVPGFVKPAKSFPCARTTQDCWSPEPLGASFGGMPSDDWSPSGIEHPKESELTRRRSSDADPIGTSGEASIVEYAHGGCSDARRWTLDGQSGAARQLQRRPFQQHKRGLTTGDLPDVEGGAFKYRKLLEDVPLIASLSPHIRHMCYSALERMHLEAGVDILVDGDQTMLSHAVFVLSGTIEATDPVNHRKAAHAETGHLIAGDVFTFNALHGGLEEMKEWMQALELHGHRYCACENTVCVRISLNSLHKLVALSKSKRPALVYDNFHLANADLVEMVRLQVSNACTRSEYLEVLRQFTRKLDTMELMPSAYESGLSSPPASPHSLNRGISKDQIRKDLARESGVFLNDIWWPLGGFQAGVHQFQVALVAELCRCGIVEGPEAGRDGWECARASAESLVCSSPAESDGLMEKILTACCRTVTGGDAYSCITQLFQNLAVTITPAGTLAPPFRISTSASTQTVTVQSVDVFKVSHFDCFGDPEASVLTHKPTVSGRFEHLCECCVDPGVG